MKNAKTKHLLLNTTTEMLYSSERPEETGIKS